MSFIVEQIFKNQKNSEGLKTISTRGFEAFKILINILLNYQSNTT